MSKCNTTKAPPCGDGCLVWAVAVLLAAVAGWLLASQAATWAWADETPAPAAVAAEEAVTMLVPVTLPRDPLQRCATKAVLGDFGEVPAWKLAIYRDVLARGLTVRGHARRTTYCPSCSGTKCADGSRVRRGICAASRNIPMHSVVWLASDGLLKVTDRGGAVRVVGACIRAGETAAFDVWLPRCVGGCWTGPGTKRRVVYAVIGR